jgi:transaldolase
MGANPLRELRALGQSIWIDNLSRSLIRDGGLAQRLDGYCVSGVTTNPSIFEKALKDGSAYDEQLRELWETATDPSEIFLALAKRDVTDACDLLRPTWEHTQGRDGYVSIEVDPTLAYEAEETIMQARRLHKEIGRPNLMVKIPATEPGLAAIEEMIAFGKSVNVTLIFSLERYAAVVEAYLRGLERFARGGGDLTQVHSVASFFVSRVDTEADRRLEEIGSDEALSLRGKLGIANARLAYQHYLEAQSGPRWEELDAQGASKQRPLWASTSSKNPAYRDTLYVEELIGPNTVNTMPPETLDAFAAHGKVLGPTILRDVPGARLLLEELKEVGVDYVDVVETLEQEGVQKFIDSFHGLLEGVSATRGQPA